MTDHVSSKNHKMKINKHIVLLIIGIITTIAAQCFKMHNPSAYTLGGLFAFILIQPVSYFVILGVVSLIIAAICRNIRKYLFPILSWLFLAAGLFDIVVVGFTEFVLRPKANQAIEELVPNDKIEVIEFDPRERILGHWSSEDDLTHQYFGQNNNLKILNLGQQKDVKYSIVDFSVVGNWIKFNISGADYEPHTRTMYFLGDGTALQVIESSVGKFGTKLKYVGPEQFPGGN